MTLWNLIRDFFVEHIFGGCTSSDVWFENNFIGQLNDANLNGARATTTTYMFPVSPTLIDADDNVFSYTQYIGLGDWLSTTFTIITLILLVIFLYIFVKWIFKLFSGLLH